MSRRTRRRLTTLAAVLAAGAILSWTQNVWSAAITAVVIVVLGLVRPPQRRPRPRRRQRPAVRTRHARQLEHTIHALYRPLDHSGQLLYVGIVVTHPGRDVHDRIDEHEDSKPWWPEVARVLVEYHPTRTAALAAEAYAIHVEQPVHNKTHRDHPLRVCPTITTARAKGYTVPAPPAGVGP